MVKQVTNNLVNANNINKAKQVTDDIVNEVIKGTYGNGTARKEALSQLGYDPSQVQEAVNQKLYGSGGSSNKATIGSDFDISMPSYSSSYKHKIDALTEQILNREAFSYNPKTDKTYQQYAKDYRRYGQMAMEDVLGKVAARTGGMASSYATSASQQAYNGYMSELASKIPELEKLAYSMYLQEGDEMRGNLNILTQLEANEYARHQDAVNAYLKALAAMNSDDEGEGDVTGKVESVYDGTRDIDDIVVDEEAIKQKAKIQAGLDRLEYYSDPFGVKREMDLDKAFMNGEITATEYEKGLKDAKQRQKELKDAFYIPPKAATNNNSFLDNMFNLMRLPLKLNL
jgi:hypothetical protein